MHEILDKYSPEELNKYASRDLLTESPANGTRFKINEIDKEYKLKQKKMVLKAIINASVILFGTVIVMNSSSKIVTIDFEAIKNNVTEISSNIMHSELLTNVYLYLFDALKDIVNKLGLVGVLLVTKAIKFVLESVQDTKEILDLRKKLNDLEEQLPPENLEGEQHGVK